jgi:NADP-dependent 3-hydroxy acid dehydrogenase YdfG
VLREEYRSTQVRCTLLSPGPTDTAVWDSVDPDNRPGFVPRHAMLRPEDVADAILWLATRPAHVDVECLRMGPGSTVLSPQLSVLRSPGLRTED